MLLVKAVMTNYRSIPKPGQTLKRVKVKRKAPLARHPQSIKGELSRPVKKTTVVRQQPVVYKPRLKSVKQPIPKNKARKTKPVPATVQHKSKKVSVKKATREARKLARQVQSQNRLPRRSPTIDQYRSSINALRSTGKNKILVIIACGPSILEVPIEKLKNYPLIDIMCVNKPEMRVWPSDYWVFCDQSQYKRNKDQFHSFKNVIINSTAVKARRDKNQIIVKGMSKAGWSRDLTRGYHIGKSTVYANMQTALWMEYEKVYIFGMDMCRVNGKLHFYGVNPDVKEGIREKRFKREADNYERAYQIMRQDERERFVICSSYNPWPFANMFERIDHKTAVDKILTHADEMRNNK